MFHLASACLMIFMFSLGHSQAEETTVDPPGHNQPLGSHTKHLDVPVVEEFPHPTVFFEEYMSKSRPLIIKSTLNATTFPAVENWTDDFFRRELGQETVLAEAAKKESRTLKPMTMPLANFLNLYKDNEIYMIQGLEDFKTQTQHTLLDEVYVPRSLLCGGLQFSIESLVMWFSSGGTKSVLHNDDYENFNCVLDGTKELILIDHEYQDQIESAGFHKDGSYSDVDVDKVDMYKFPRLQETTVYKARITKGDCLYIPYQWYHQVNSPGGRSLAINFWFVPTTFFNTTDCHNKEFKEQTKPVHDVGVGHLDYLTWFKFTWVFGREEVSKRKYEERIGKELPELKHIQNELFLRLDTDRSSSLTQKELFEVDIHKILKEFPAIVAVMNENNETPPEPSHDEL